jgi:acyl-CoA thioester hydrolase
MYTSYINGGMCGEMKTETCFSVIYTEVDGMGIVHHSRYPLWFEKGRKHFLKKAGTSNSRMAGKGFFLPLTEMECKYLCPAKYGDEIIVFTQIISMTCVKIIFEYEVFEKKKRKLIAIGKTVHAWTNGRIEPVNIEKAAPDIYWRLKQFSKFQDEM